MSTYANHLVERAAAVRAATRVARALAQGLSAAPHLHAASTVATRSASVNCTSSTSTPAKPAAAPTAPTNATSTDDGDSGTSATEHMAAVPQASTSKGAQLRTTNFLLSAAMSLLMAAFALISIQSLIAPNTTAASAIHGVITLLILLIQLCIAYALLNCLRESTTDTQPTTTQKP